MGRERGFMPDSQLLDSSAKARCKLTVNRRDGVLSQSLREVPILA